MNAKEVTQEAWGKTKLLVKVAVIAGIIGLLMIPTCQVQQLISERESRQKEAVNEVSAKWAGRQLVTAPVLVLPYRAGSTNGRDDTLPTVANAIILPDTVEIRAVADPREKHRGMYQVMLYSARAEVTARFAAPNLAALHIDPASVLWDRAYLRLQLGDLRGLNEEVDARWNGTSTQFAPQAVEGDDTATLVAALALKGAEDLQSGSFTATLALNGSQQLLFAPLGRKSTVTVRSPWPHPSFTGEGLPVESKVASGGFDATWRMGANRRAVPQQYTEAGGPRYDLARTAVGVDLFVPVNAYQKTMRSIKYALLCIVLTFAAFFLIEMVNKRSVHPFQYGLIGLALVLFYALLLSFSEYIGFNPAYAIASIATIGLIGWFVRGLLQSGRLSTLLSVVLVLLYGFVFTTLQLQDYSLLLGSVALFLTLGVIMYFSRRINW
ncbi:cell envelope integrity protein CreD [Flaviaesturariibacter flavus]|uniref:Cell envelope integrity protein CreD n=1 Tax=Flaviaesturariibacter flavus TaxID=2502780 RepID=A0A4R1BBD5_9BACT|nr:cell envelope integrity protein CreD [Flaviaesturariibacter flavus]TCJ14300.1 cell envelope integrity protein CreD [Flaviaesturariibacter flavus]